MVLLILGGAFFLVPRKRPIETYLNRAEEAFQNKDFNSSIELYLKSLKYYPKNERTPETLLAIGDIYNFSLGNIEKAGKAYEMVTQKYPKTIFSRQALQRSGEMYQKNQQFEEALLQYQGIIDRFPSAGDIDEIRYRVAMMALKMKKYEPARRSLMSIIESNPNTNIADKVLYQIGNIFFVEGAAKETVQVLEVATEKFPSSPLIFEMKFTLANAYEEIGEIKKALTLYKSIQSNYPNPQVIEKKIENLTEQKRDPRLTPSELKEMKEKAKRDAKAKGIDGSGGPMAPKMKRKPVAPQSLNGNDEALRP